MSISICSPWVSEKRLDEVRTSALKEIKDCAVWREHPTIVIEADFGETSKVWWYRWCKLKYHQKCFKIIETVKP